MAVVCREERRFLQEVSGRAASSEAGGAPMAIGLASTCWSPMGRSMSALRELPGCRGRLRGAVWLSASGCLWQHWPAISPQPCPGPRSPDSPRRRARCPPMISAMGSAGTRRTLTARQLELVPAAPHEPVRRIPASLSVMHLAGLVRAASRRRPRVAASARRSGRLESRIAGPLRWFYCGRWAGIRGGIPAPSDPPRRRRLPSPRLRPLPGAGARQGSTLRRG